MPPARRGRDIATARVDWPQAWRIIASRYPPIHLFERVSANPAVWDALIALESATNPRLRDEIGEISLVAPERRSPRYLGEFVASEIRKWGVAIKASGASMD